MFVNITAKNHSNLIGLLKSSQICILRVSQFCCAWLQLWEKLVKKTGSHFDLFPHVLKLRLDPRLLSQKWLRKGKFGWVLFTHAGNGLSRNHWQTRKETVIHLHLRSVCDNVSHCISLQNVYSRWTGMTMDIMSKIYLTKWYGSSRLKNKYFSIVFFISPMSLNCIISRNFITFRFVGKNYNFAK
jgi:hypothetical protein